MKRGNGKSISVKLSITMVVVIVLQAVLLIGSVISSGVVTSLRDNAYSSLNDKVNNRKNYLQTELNSRFSNIESYAHDIIADYDSMESSGKWENQKQADEFLLKVAPKIILALRSTMTTGSFLVLNDSASPQSPYSGVYLRDSDPVSNNEENRDVFMLKGPVPVSQSLLIPLEPNWSYGISFEEDQRDIFEKPFSVGGKSSKLKLLGYWHVSPSMSETGDLSLTYSMPLVGANGVIFGVLGVEISQKYLYKMLPGDELSPQLSMGYVLARQDKTTGVITPVMDHPSQHYSAVVMELPMELSVANEEYGSYYLSNTSYSTPVICNTKSIKLYNNNTPFDNESWLLIGMVGEKAIIEFSHRFQQTLVVAFFASVLIGIVVVCITSKTFVKPVIALAEKVRTNDPHAVADMVETGFSEIDELASAIVGLNQSVVEFSLKTDKIIEMVNLPLGTFQFKKGSGVVNCSPNLLSILNFNVVEDADNSIESNAFFEKINHVMNSVEDEERNIYMLRDNPAAWVKIVLVENENSIFGIVMDVTHEVLDSHSIKFERDYDGLTKIYNRVAFRREAEMIFDHGVSGTSAFLMFDLDNLKYINDVYGHDTGDDYIRMAARLLTRYMPRNALVGRMSGDEFYVFLHDQSDREAVWQIIEDMYAGFEANMMVLPNGEPVKLRMSGGIAWYGEHSTSLDELIQFADFAMYQGKHNIKGVVMEFDRTTYESDFFMLSGREELNKILENQLVDFVFQPIISAKNGQLYAFESLMRPRSEVLTTPTKLMQIAKSQSNLWQVERLTFFKTLEIYSKYFEGLKDCKIFINSVPNERLKDAEYAEIERLYPKMLKKIVIEITENEKLDGETLAFKRELTAKWGGQMALDDYGSGYNGDIALLRIEPQIVKIDRLLIADIENDRNRQSIVQKLVRYGSEQGVLILAEGVETRGQMEKIISMGVDLMQGFYISDPLKVPAFDTKAIVQEIAKIKSNS